MMYAATTVALACMASSVSAEITMPKAASFMERYLVGNVPGNSYLDMYTDDSCFCAKELLVELQGVESFCACSKGDAPPEGSDMTLPMLFGEWDDPSQFPFLLSPMIFDGKGTVVIHECTMGANGVEKGVGVESFGSLKLVEVGGKIMIKDHQNNGFKLGCSKPIGGIPSAKQMHDLGFPESKCPGSALKAQVAVGMTSGGAALYALVVLAAIAMGVSIGRTLPRLVLF